MYISYYIPCTFGNIPTAGAFANERRVGPHT